MAPYERAKLWGDMTMVAQAILDQSERQDLEMVKDRNEYLATLIEKMSDE